MSLSADGHQRSFLLISHHGLVDLLNTSRTGSSVILGRKADDSELDGRKSTLSIPDLFTTHEIDERPGDTSMASVILSGSTEHFSQAKISLRSNSQSIKPCLPTGSLSRSDILKACDFHDPLDHRQTTTTALRYLQTAQEDRHRYHRSELASEKDQDIFLKDSAVREAERDTFAHGAGKVQLISPFNDCYVSISSNLKRTLDSDNGVVMNDEKIKLCRPSIILLPDELTRNNDSIEKESTRSLSTKSGKKSKRILIIDGKKRYLCPFSGCEKTFSTSGHAMRHARVHTGCKPYQCFFFMCNARFSRLDNALQHFRSHDPHAGNPTM